MLALICYADISPHTRVSSQPKNSKYQNIFYITPNIFHILQLIFAIFDILATK
jgi:hypothetical protein